MEITNNKFEEFKKRHCEKCGTQRCGGVYDEDFREGCEYYQHEILHKKTLEDILYEENKRTYDSFLAAHGCFESKGPTDDAREVKHGKWICMSDADGYYYRCSACGESLERISISPCAVENPYPELVSCSKTRFCPSCGVVMDE